MRWAATGACLLALLALAPGTPLQGQAGSAVEARVDHVILGIGDLEAGIATFEELSGVRATFGGEHPGVGTHNALASLGEGTYLELIAPRSGVEVGDPWTSLEGLEELTPVGWAVGTDDLAGALAALRAAGFETTEPTAGSRVTPDGATLRWSAAGLAEPGPGTAPFLIEWAGESPHPSTTSPAGCRLEGLEVREAQPDRVARLVRALGLGPDVDVATGTSAGLVVTLRCPTGQVVLGER